MYLQIYTDREANMNFRKSRWLVTGWCALIAMLLSGCGGGGSGGGASVPPASKIIITSANAPQVASAAINSAYALNGQSSALGQVLGVSITTNSSAPSLGAITRRIFKQAIQVTAPVAVTGVVVKDTVSCWSQGTVTATANVANVNSLTAGDSISATFDTCDDEFGVLITGTINLTITNFSGDPLLLGAFTLGVRVSTPGLLVMDGLHSEAITGGFTLTSTSPNGVNITDSFSGSSLTITANGVIGTFTNFNMTATRNISTNAYTFSISGTIASSTLGGSISIQTTNTISGVDPSDPDTGQLVVSGANGTSVTVTVIDSTNIQLDVDEDGDGVADKTINTTWAALS